MPPTRPGATFGGIEHSHVLIRWRGIERAAVQWSVSAACPPRTVAGHGWGLSIGPSAARGTHQRALRRRNANPAIIALSSAMGKFKGTAAARVYMATIF